VGGRETRGAPAAVECSGGRWIGDGGICTTAQIRGMQDFKKLHVWQRSQDLAAALYGATADLRGRDVVSLRSQLRRAAQSIAANIAEGANAASPKDFARYLQMAIASASETESHLDLALRTAVMPASVVMPLIDEVIAARKMLIVLRKRVLESRP